MAVAIAQFVWFAAAALFIVGLRSMSSPVTARAGIRWAGLGMVAAVAATLALPGLNNHGLMLAAIGLGGGLAWVSGKRVPITGMPQMVAIYNGMGGGAAAAIAAIELARGDAPGLPAAALAAGGALIGAVSFTGSCVAFLKLQGLLKKPIRLAGQNLVNAGLTLAAFAMAGWLAFGGPAPPAFVVAFFLVCLLLGAVVTLPIGGADMPVVISLLNAFTGLAVGFEGYVLGSPLLIIAGIVVGAAGALLTQLMAKAMNRSLANILFIPLQPADAGAAEGEACIQRPITSADVAALLRYSNQVVIVPGYGMAVAHAQHKVWEMSALLEGAGVKVRFAIHPVAGRMPGHMNVLLAEAGVPYEKIFDLEEINADFAQTDAVLVIGANDVVNPAARSKRSSPIYGMPILNVDQAQNVVVVKRGQGAGYAGVDNALFCRENCRMLHGNAQPVVAEIIQHLKPLL